MGWQLLGAVHKLCAHVVGMQCLCTCNTRTYICAYCYFCISNRKLIFKMFAKFVQREESLEIGESQTSVGVSGSDLVNLGRGPGLRGADLNKCPPRATFLKGPDTDFKRSYWRFYIEANEYVFTLCANYSFETGKACVSLSALFLEVMQEVFQPDYCLWSEEFRSVWLTTCWYFISLELLKSL